MNGMKRSLQQKDVRRAGILMPVSSLPSAQGIGTLGKGAYQFVDWLESAGMKLWQVLPLLPTSYGDSPYQSFASDALNYYFIDFDMLAEQGLLQKSDYESLDWGDDERRVDYGKQFSQKAQVLKKAFSAFDKKNAAWQEFLASKRSYAFALFVSLKIRFGYKAWDEWDEPFKRAEKGAIVAHEKEYAEEIAFWQFTQFVFLEQWQKLKAYANAKGISIMGDMPIYVAYDSVETWLHRKELFVLDEKGNTSLRAGVPPDGFCEDGQLWGNPVYDWKKMKKDGYAWWKNRIRYAFSCFDVVRIDHFRGFDRFYAIPAQAKTAKEGEWLHGPKSALFEDMESYAIVAEDLGVIDDGVRTLMQETGYPGMKVFEFAFNGDPENEYLPSQYTENCVAYTGTHDNDTLRSFLETMSVVERRTFEEAFEKECLTADVAYICETVEDECESIIRLLMQSKANTVIVPMQDVLCLGEEARMNAPSTVSNRNWTFRFTQTDFKKRKAAWLRLLAEEYKRI